MLGGVLSFFAGPLGIVAKLFGFGLKLGKGLFGWLRTLSIYQIGCIALTLFSLYQHFHIVRIEHHDAATSRALAAEKLSHAADTKRYREAQITARRLNDEQIAAIIANRNAITERIIRDKDTNIAHLRELAAAGKLQPGIYADRGHTSGSPSSAVGQGATGTADPSGLCLSPKELLSAAESEERHDRLIDVVIELGNVDTNKPIKPAAPPASSP